MQGRLLPDHLVIDVTNGLFPHLRCPTGYGGTGGSEILPWVSCMYMSYQSLAPSLPEGRLGGPPEVARVPLLLVEACPPLWRRVDDFPLCLDAVVIPLWLEVDGHLPWLRVGSCLLPPGLVDSCPADSQRLPWMESWFGPALMEVVHH